MSILRDDLEAVYVVYLPKFLRDVEAGRYLEDWLGYYL